MTGLTTRERGIASVLAFDVVKLPFDPRLVELFADLNAGYFDRSLPIVPVRQGIPHGAGEPEDLYGLVTLEVHPRPDVPSLASVTIYLADELFEAPWASEDDRWAKVTDTLLHQMVHLAIDLDALGGAHPFEDHHGRHFTAECNRIGERMGWERVRASSDALGRSEDAAGWPDNAIERADG